MFSPIKNTKVYEQVIEQIKGMIADGTLNKGDKLPSERDLVDQLRVSRTSIREALRSLEVIGLIECRQGEGNFINTNFDNNLFEPISIMFMLQESSPEEMLELRRIIEVETAALAAKRITEQQLNDIKELLDRFKTSDDEAINVKLDKDFHYKIAYASQNFLIVSILKAVSSLMDAFIKDARKKILMDEDRGILLAQHESIYKALVEHDSKLAANSMRKHLDFTNHYMSKYK